MTISKPALDGIGTASGVAWPLFGILSTTLNLGIGGAAAFILGSICGITFLFISLTITYLTHQNLKKQQQDLDRKKDKYESQLISNLLSFFATLKQYENLSTTINLTTFLEKKAQEFDQSVTDKDKIMANFLRYLKSKAIYNTYNPLEPKLFNIVLKKHIKQFLISQLNDKVYSDAAEKTKIAIGTFQGFIGTFGTLAGGSAGLTGLLVGVGLMTSLSIIPWVGIAIIVITAIVAIYMADKAAKSTESNINKTTWCQQAKNLSYSIQSLNNDLREQVQSSPTLDSRVLPSNTSPMYLGGPIIEPYEGQTIMEDELLTNTQTISDKKPTKHDLNQEKSINECSPCNSSYHKNRHAFFDHKNLTDENKKIIKSEVFSI